MRILQVLNILGAGGAEQYVIQLSDYLIENNDEVTIIGGQPFTIKDRIPLKADVQLIQLHPGYGKPVYSYFLNLLPNIYKIYKLIKKQNIELVQTHLAASALPAWIAAKMAGVPVVHSKMHMQAVATGFEKVLFKSPFPKWLISKYLALSHYSIIEMEKFWRVPKDKIQISSIGVDADRYDPKLLSMADARKALGLDEKAIVFSAVARFCPEKNVDLAIEGFAAMKNKQAILLLAGDGPEREKMEQIVAQHNIADSVRFLGQQLDPRPVYAASNMIIQTTRGPNMGMISLEALSMGIPLLIAARDQEEREMAFDTLNWRDIGLVVDATPVAIGRVLDDMAISPRFYTDKSKDARDYVLEKHNKKQVFKGMQFFYHSYQLSARKQ